MFFRSYGQPVGLPSEEVMRERAKQLAIALQSKVPKVALVALARSRGYKSPKRWAEAIIRIENVYKQDKR